MSTQGLLTGVFRARVGDPDLDLVGTVLAVSAIPYGRPQEPSPRGVLADWRGTCSTKHLLLAGLVDEAWPEVGMTLWHRVYRLTPAWAAARWGPAVVSRIPPDGLVDVHTFATARLDAAGAVQLDVTVPLEAWDGSSSTALACGPGVDHPAGSDPLRTKAALVSHQCDPAAREAFIAALTEWVG